MATQPTAAPGGAPSTTAVTSSPTTVADAAGQHTIDASPGGTVVVSVTGDQITLVRATPAAGWTVASSRHDDNELRVEFVNGSQRVRVQAELDDGGLEVKVEREKVTSTSTSTPGASSPSTSVATGRDDDGDDDGSGRGDGSDHGGRGGSGGRDD